MASRWDKHGVWCDGLRPDEKEGRWLVGDLMTRDHPGYMPDKTRVIFKVWRAMQGTRYDGDMRSGGHVRQVPAHGGGMLEFVHVLSGYFYFMGVDCIPEMLCPMSRKFPDVIESKTLLPTDGGRWYLNQSEYAAGVTTCRPGNQIPEVFGSGIGYDYRVLDTDFNEPDDWKKIISGSMEGYRYRLIVVFEGTVWHLDKGKTVHELKPFNWAYLTPKSTMKQWFPDGEGRTVAVVLTY